MTFQLMAEGSNTPYSILFPLFLALTILLSKFFVSDLASKIYRTKNLLDLPFPNRLKLSFLSVSIAGVIAFAGVLLVQQIILPF
jgi:hypothetical protein